MTEPRFRFGVATARSCGVAAISLLMWACGRERAASGGTDAVRPASVSAEQFRSLAWLSGRWRGTDSADAAAAPFFEAYMPWTGTAIRSYSYADSAFSAPSDSGLLQLKGDTLFSGSPSMQWVATHLDSARIEFAPWRGASNRFSWQRTAAGEWTATLQWDSAGVPRRRVYEMRGAGSPPSPRVSPD